MDHLGTIPEGTGYNAVTSFTTPSAPGTIVVRANALHDVLVYDVDAGFSWPWKNRSSIEDYGNGTYTVHLGSGASVATAQAFFWSPDAEVGSTGPQGPAGPAGADGADGAPGADGVDYAIGNGLEVVTLEGDHETLLRDATNAQKREKSAISRACHETADGFTECEWR